MSFKLIRLQERMAWLKELLTQPNLEEKVDHYERQRLLEEAEELDARKRELEKEGMCRS